MISAHYTNSYTLSKKKKHFKIFANKMFRYQYLLDEFVKVKQTYINIGLHFKNS